MERSTGKILVEKPGSVCFPPDTGRLIHLSAGQNLIHKAKLTLELLIKKTVNVPEWPSYSFYLNLLENLMARP
jgi:hypothetical protein